MSVHDEAAEGEKTQSAAAASEETPPMVVGIGGSAGALAAVMTLLQTLGDEVDAAIVVVVHLAPDHESSAAEILQRLTSLRVSQVKSRTRLTPRNVYVIAPGMNLITDDGHIQPAEGSPRRPSAVIDLFFRSLGQAHGERAVGIVLSGTGRDGSLGLSHIKECGGLTIAQSAEDAEFADMPKAAVATGSVDLVLTAEEIGRRLGNLAKLPRAVTSLRPVNGSDDLDPPAVVVDEQAAQRAYHDILTTLRVFTRHDFRHYKRATVLRRLERRMMVNGLANLQEYRDFVRDHPAELAPLLADMLISVTNFFRDPQAFEKLQRDVIPVLMDGVDAGEELRVWVPACASGEESYSVAILLQEYADRMPQPPRIQNVCVRYQ